MRMSIEKLRTVFTGRVITVNVETVRLPNGHVADLEIIHHPGGAAAVAVDDAAAGVPDPPIPSCRRRLDLGAAGRQARAAASRRSRRRGANWRRKPGTSAHNWSSLGLMSVPRGFYRNRAFVPGRELDSGKMAHEAAELIEVHWIDLEEACARALDGDFRRQDSLGLLRARAAVRPLER